MVLFLFVTWEQRKLGGEAEELLAGGDIDNDLICESGRYPVIANALTNDGIVGFYEKYYRVEAPAVTVTGRGDVGHAQARRVNFTPVVRLLSIKSRHNVDFLENAINRGEVIIESTGVPQLTVPQLSKRTISFPQTVQEEEKIGKLFFKIDNLITLHQRKQKCNFWLFVTPKAGSFLAHSWEQRKLGDTIDFYSGLTYSPSDIVKDDGVFVLRSCNVQEGEIVDEDNVYVRAGAVNSDNVSVDDIIVVVRNGSRSLIGKHAKIKKNMPKTVIGAYASGDTYATYGQILPGSSNSNITSTQRVNKPRVEVRDIASLSYDELYIKCDSNQEIIHVRSTDGVATGRYEQPRRLHAQSSRIRTRRINWLVFFLLFFAFPPAAFIYSLVVCGRTGKIVSAIFLVLTVALIITYFVLLHVNGII